MHNLVKNIKIMSVSLGLSLELSFFSLLFELNLSQNATDLQGSCQILILDTDLKAPNYHLNSEVLVVALSFRVLVL